MRSNPRRNDKIEPNTGRRDRTQERARVDAKREHRDQIQDAAMRSNPKPTNEIEPKKERGDQSQERGHRKEMEGGKVLRSEPKQQPSLLLRKKRSFKNYFFALICELDVDTPKRQIPQVALQLV